MNHRDPAQLMRLVTTLRLELPEAPIVVHNDKFRTHIAPSALDPIGKGHPDVFVAADLPELLAAPEHEFFARKFDMARDAEILDELDRRLARARATPYGASSDGY